EPGGRRGGAVRALARLCSGYCRPGHREPDRNAALDGDAPRARARPPRRGAAAGRGDRRGARVDADLRPRRHGVDVGLRRRGAGAALTGGSARARSRPRPSSESATGTFLKGEVPVEPPVESPRGARPGVGLAILALAGSGYAMLQSLVVPALPTLQKELDTSPTG